MSSVTDPHTWPTTHTSCNPADFYTQNDFYSHLRRKYWLMFSFWSFFLMNEPIWASKKSWIHEATFNNTDTFSFPFISINIQIQTSVQNLAGNSRQGINVCGFLKATVTMQIQHRWLGDCTGILPSCRSLSPHNLCHQSRTCTCLCIMLQF